MPKPTDKSGTNKTRSRARHPVTGCRLDTIMGLWLVDSQILAEWRDTGWAIVERGELPRTQARSAEVAAQAEAKPYTVEDGIARLSLSGPMTKYDTSMSSLFGGTSTARVRKAAKAIAAAHKSGEVKACFIDVDSPGGTVDGTSELASAIRKLSTAMPVHVHAEDMACSAALWAAVQGTRFTCGASAKVGSMGVITQMVDASKMGQDDKAKPIIFQSGKFKAIGAPGHPVTAEQRAEVQRHCDNLAAIFRHDVTRGRPNMTKAQMEEAATARVFLGQDAVRVGLCDAVCTADEAWDYARQHMNDTPQPAARGPGEGNSPPAAIRSSTMTEAQVRQLQEFAGTGHIVTTDNADAIAVGLCANLRTENQRLAADLEKARKNTATTAAALDPEVLRSRCESAIERVQILQEKGKLTGGEAAALCAAFLSAGKVDLKTGALSADAQPIAALFDRAQDGTYPYQKFLNVHAEAKPSDVNRDVTGHQPAPRETPGEGGGSKAFVANNVGGEMTFDEANRIRAAAQLPPYTRDQYRAAHPDARDARAA